VVPAIAAAIRGDKAVLFVVQGDQAKKIVVTVKGEETGTLYLDPSLPAGSHVVTEGRSLLNDDDRVVAKLEEAALTPPPSTSAAGGKKP
jgi:hypothetical protein